MLEETVFNKETIINIINDKYNIKVYDIKKINRGSANIYSLNNDMYILKEFQSKYTEEEINKEISIINHLKKDNLLVPEYISTIDGKYSFKYKNKIVILQKFIDGYTIESNEGTYEQMIESAKVLGQIVKSLETLDYELPVDDFSSLYDITNIDNSIIKHKELMNKIDSPYKNRILNDLKEKITMLEYIKDNLNSNDIKNMTLKNTHGDYSVLQFIYKEDKINAVIDFVSACKIPIVWEIIRSYSYIDKNVKEGIIDINNLIDYVKEFTKHVKLNEYDIKNMPYLYMLQLLSSTFGYKEYINDKRKVNLLDFAFFRTKLCKNLFKNLKLIQDNLKNIV